MLEKLCKKNERGFTLAELLVVVAIIAILVAISIPIFTSKLEASREATDAANLRAAKAAATVAVLSEGTVNEYFYDAETGKLVASKTGIVGYGKGTSSGDVASHEGQILQVTVDGVSGDETVAVNWVD